ncbi:hypothetical protein LRR18_18525, partial [Mangrovimonas sp. AS39]|uniref:hypothetical protein n=1 Tax=Mangrovimonas futianensis TaxID=2895523 RepID=UPI001E4DF2F3
HIKDSDLVLVDELKDNWHVAEVIKEAKKTSLQIPPIDRLSTEDKKHLLEVIKVKALEVTNKIKLELTYKEQKITLTEEELTKVLRVKELLNPI